MGETVAFYVHLTMVSQCGMLVSWKVCVIANKKEEWKEIVGG